MSSFERCIGYCCIECGNANVLMLLEERDLEIKIFIQAFVCSNIHTFCIIDAAIILVASSYSSKKRDKSFESGLAEYDTGKLF